MITSMFTFPLESLGKALRDMSLTGTADNVAAIIIFALFGLSPLFLWMFLKKKKLTVKADYLLFFLSAVFFYSLYYSINPGLFKTQLAGAEGIYISGLFYSGIVTYGVIRIWAIAMSGSRQTIHMLLKVFLAMVAVIFGLFALMEFTIRMPQALEEVRAAYES